MRMAWFGLWVLMVVGVNVPTVRADDPAARFAELYEQLQQKTEEAQQIRAEYANAEGEQREALAERFHAIVEALEALTPEVADATVAAYKAAPNADEQVTRMLGMIAENLVERDQFERARQVTKLMIEHEHPESRRHELAGTAAFAVGDFEAAAAHYETAREQGAMTQRASQFAGAVADYRAHGEAERAIREAEAEADDLPRVKLETSEGELIVELFENEAPNTVANFIRLIEDGFYDGLTFHRVLPNFMAQGGCPDGTGTGGPGHHIPCELDDDYRRHFRGTLSMAHAGRDTGGSQFFLTFLPTPHLNGRHTAFGRVIEGMDVLGRLNRVDPQRPQAGVEPSRIVEATVLRKRDHDYEVETLPAR